MSLSRPCSCAIDSGEPFPYCLWYHAAGTKCPATLLERSAQLHRKMPDLIKGTFQEIAIELFKIPWCHRHRHANINCAKWRISWITFARWSHYTFALHQCQYGATTRKLTRFITSKNNRFKTPKFWEDVHPFQQTCFELCFLSCFVVFLGAHIHPLMPVRCGISPLAVAGAGRNGVWQPGQKQC